MGFLSAAGGDTEARLAAVEAQLARISQHLGIDCPPMPGAALADPGSGAGAEIRDLLARGKKIEAIKRYREETGAGLAEAKSAVEAIEAGGAPQPPRPDIGL